MKHGEADRTLQGKEIKCKKNANNLLFAPFFEAFIGGVSSAHGKEKVKKGEFEVSPTNHLEIDAKRGAVEG